MTQPCCLGTRIFDRARAQDRARSVGSTSTDSRPRQRRRCSPDTIRFRRKLGKWIKPDRVPRMSSDAVRRYRRLVASRLSRRSRTVNWNYLPRSSVVCTEHAERRGRRTLSCRAVHNNHQDARDGGDVGTYGAGRRVAGGKRRCPVAETTDSSARRIIGSQVHRGGRMACDTTGRFSSPSLDHDNSPCCR